MRNNVNVIVEQAEAGWIHPDMAASHWLRMYPAENDGWDLLIAASGCILVASGYAMFDLHVIHWFLVPIIVLGTMIGKDLVAWCRGRTDILDPKSINAAIGVVFFFLAPIVYVHARGELRDMPHPLDWRPWFGYMGFINCVGVLLYLSAQRLGFRGVPKSARRYWQAPGGVPLSLFLATLVSVSAWTIVYVRMGGYSGMAEAAENQWKSAAGLGVLMVVGESVPLLFLLLTCLRGGAIWRRKSWAITTAIAVTAMMVAQLLVSGLSGSRSRVMWAMFWVLGVVHFFWRPLKRRHIIILVLLALGFMYVYAFYKDFGKDIFGVFRGQSVSHYTAKSKRSLDSIIAGDIGRSDMQASVLYAIICVPEERYDMRWGRTYVFGMINSIPRWVWFDKPYSWSKASAAYELSEGKPSRYVFGMRGRPMTMQFGLAGEAMINFWLVGPFLAFPIWGFLVGRLRRMYAFLQPGDMRLMLCLFFTVMLFVALASDMDNIIDVFVWRAGFPMLIIWFISRKMENPDYVGA